MSLTQLSGPFTSIIWTSKSDAVQILDHQNAIYQSLLNDINIFVSKGAQDSNINASLLGLQSAYAGFYARWVAWYQGERSAWIFDQDTANQAIDSFDAEYSSYRDQFVKLGGNPSMNITSPSSAIANVVTIVSIAAIFVAGAYALSRLPSFGGMKLVSSK